MAGIVKIAFADIVGGRPIYDLLLVNQVGTQRVQLGSIDEVEEFTSDLQQNRVLRYFDAQRAVVNQADGVSDAMKASALADIEQNQTAVIDALKISNQFDIGTTVLIDAGEGTVLDAAGSLAKPISDEALAAALDALAEAAA